MSELNRQSIEEFRGSKKLPVIIVLDNIRSLHNVGSVFRTADAFSIEKVILTGITAVPPHREIQKTALGATESVEWEYFEKCDETVLALKESDTRVFGVEQVGGSKSLNVLDIEIKSNRVALVFGNEVKGVDQKVLDLCDDYIEIPQSGTKHSLNVSVSVGVVLWEFVRKLKE